MALDGGTAILKVIADTSKLSSQIATGTAKATSGVAGVANKLSTAITTTLTNPLILAAGVATAAIVKFGQSSIQAFEESEAVAAQTAAVLKSTGNAAGFTADQIHEMAAAFQRSTTFSDEQVQSAENLILTFTNIGHKVFPQTTQAVLDMSTALGQDLKSSAIQLGKALNDPIKGVTALRRVGVAFDAQQIRTLTHLAETNQILKAQKIILEEVGKEFGGSATAAAKTFQGQIEQLKNEFNDFQEKIGQALVPVIQQLITDLKGLGAEISGILNLIPGFNDGVGEAADKVSGLQRASALAAFGLHAILHPLSTLLHGFTIEFPTAVADADEALQTHAKNLGLSVDAYNKMKEAQQAAKEATKKWAQDAIKQFTLVGVAATAVKDTFTLTAAAAVKAVAGTASAQRRIANDLKQLDRIPIGDDLKRKLIELGPALVDAFVKGTPAQRKAIKDSLKVTQDAVKDGNDVLKKIARDGGEGVGKGLMDGAVKGVVDNSSGLKTAAATAVREAIQAARDAADAHSPSREMIKLGKDMVKGLVIGLNDAATLQGFSRIIEKVISKLRDIVSDLRSQISDATSEVKKAFLRMQVEAVQAQTVIARGWEKTLNEASKHFDKLQDRFRSFKDSIRAGFAQLQDLAGAIGGLFGQTDENGNPIGVSVGDISSAIANQVAQAQLLAQLLKQSAAAGLSKNLIAQFAGQGASAIPELQALLSNPELIEQLNEAAKEISEAAGNTANALGDKFFGKALERAADKLDHLREVIERFIESLGQASTFQPATATGNGNGNGPPVPDRPEGNGGKPRSDIFVTVNGWVGNDQQIAQRIRDELDRISRNNR